MSKHYLICEGGLFGTIEVIPENKQLHCKLCTYTGLFLLL